MTHSTSDQSDSTSSESTLTSAPRPLPDDSREAAKQLGATVFGEHEFAVLQQMHLPGTWEEVLQVVSDLVVLKRDVGVGEESDAASIRPFLEAVREEYNLEAGDDDSVIEQLQFATGDGPLSPVQFFIGTVFNFPSGFPEMAQQRAFNKALGEGRDEDLERMLVQAAYDLCELSRDEIEQMYGPGGRP